MPNRVNGRGGMVAITSGNPTAVPNPPAWAAAEDYVLDDLVTVGSGTSAREALCVNGHTSTSTGLSVTSGALSGADADNWKLVAVGTITALRNWSYSTTETTEQETYVVDDADRTVGTTLATTGTLEYADDDAEDVAQQAIRVGNEVALTLYPKGLGTGRPEISGTVRFTQVDSAFSTSVLVKTVNFAVQGAWTESDQ